MHPLILLQRAAARKAQNTEKSTSVTMDGLDNAFSPLAGLPLSSQLTVAQEDAQQQLYGQSPPRTSSSFSSSSSFSLSPFPLDVSDSRTSSPPTPYSPYFSTKETSSLPFPDFPFEGRLQVPETAFRFIPPNLNSNDEGNHALSVDGNPYAALGFTPFPQYTQDPSLPVFLNASGFPSTFTLTNPQCEDAEPPRKKHCTDPAIHDILHQINHSPCSECGKSEAGSSMSGAGKCVQCASKPSHDEPVLPRPLLQSPNYTSERITQMATIEPGQTLMSQSFPQIPALSSDPAEDVIKHLDDPEVRRMIAEQYVPPALILRGIVSPEEVRQLFVIFFERLNPHIEVLRQDTHTIPTLLARCPLLFTVICTLASRYLVSRPDLYPIALSLAKEAISAACFSDHADPTGSQISADTCLALALFSLWTPPSAHQNNAGLFRDKRWIWAGLSVRMAEELAANLPPAQTAGATVPLPSPAISLHGSPNGTSGARHSSDDLFGPIAVLELCRTIDSMWSILRSASFGLSAPASPSVQSSSTASLSQALEGLRSAMAWSVLTRRNPVEDGGEVVQFAKSLQSQLPHVMGGFIGNLIRSSPPLLLASGGVGAAKSIQKCLATLDQLGEQARVLTGRGDMPGMNVLCQNILLDICYYRLVVHTLELQTSPDDNAYLNNGLQKRRGRPSKTSKSREPLVSTCMSDARSILLMVSEVFGPSGILRCATERTLGQITAVALFIIRMISDSHLTPYLEGDQTDYILFLKDFACTLHDAAVDEHHSLAIYSKFVREQLRSPSKGFQNDTELPVFLLERAFRPLG